MEHAGVEARNRFILVCFAIGILILGSLALLLRWQDARLADALAAQRLQITHATQRLVERQLSNDLKANVDLLVGDQAFVAYVAEALRGNLPGLPVDTHSVLDLLNERRGQMGFTLAAVLDGDGHLVVATQRFAQQEKVAREPLFGETRKTLKTNTRLWRDGSRLLQVAIAPLSPKSSAEGFLLVANELENNVAKEMGNVASADVVLLAMTENGPRIAASTLDPSVNAGLGDALLGNTDDSVQMLEFDGREYRVAMQPLLDGNGGKVLTLVAPERWLASVRALRVPMLVAVGASALCLLIIAIWLWRRVLLPAALLTQLMEHAEHGDFHIKLGNREGGALQSLADSFNQLMAALTLNRSVDRRALRGNVNDRRKPDA